MPASALSARPLKVATPELATAVLLVTDTPPEVIVAVTVEPSPVTTLPAESSTLTTGCWLSAAPEASLALGEVVMTSLEAAPVAMAMLFELALVKLSPVKLNW